MNYRRIGCQIPLRSVYLSPRLGHRPLDQHPTTIQHPEYESANVSTVVSFFLPLVLLRC